MNDKQLIKQFASYIEELLREAVALNIETCTPNGDVEKEIRDMTEGVLGAPVGSATIEACINAVMELETIVKVAKRGLN